MVSIQNVGKKIDIKTDVHKSAALKLECFHRYREYSVLMSVYKNELPDYLYQSISSIQAQTIPASEFVLVCDGPLTNELDLVISKKQSEMGEKLKVVRLEQNKGLGNALNIGLTYCTNELVARMDSDDIACKERCEKQLRVFNEKTDISICSGDVFEFSNIGIDVRRSVPEYQSEILRFAKWRNPFNHPCVMYKKDAVLSVGSYLDFYLLEDYYLWIRLLLKGYKGYNIQDVLLYMRAGEAMYKRRSGFDYMLSQIQLLKYMKYSGFINCSEFFLGCLLRSVSSLSPNKLRRLVFRKTLRVSH